MSLALCGPHRSGKSTLAREYAKKYDIPFVETSVGAIYKDMGYDPAVTYDFVTRLGIQEEILKRVDAEVYKKHSGETYITDRSPVDMAAYTLADAIGDRVPDASYDRLMKYIADCMDIAAKRFSMICLIRPGIPLVGEANKAVLNRAYIEHLDVVMMGLMRDLCLKTDCIFLDRDVTDLNERIELVRDEYLYGIGQCEEEKKRRVKNGDIFIH